MPHSPLVAATDERGDQRDGEGGGTDAVAPHPMLGYELCVRKVEDADIEGLDLSSWRVALNGAEPVTPSVLRAFVERFSAWGLPETGLRYLFIAAAACFPVALVFGWKLTGGGHERAVR